MFPWWFSFCKNNHFTESIIRKYGAEFKRGENVGEIVQYLLMHLSVEAIRSKLKHFHSYMNIRQGLHYFIKQWRYFKVCRNNCILL